MTRIGSRNWIMAYVHIAHDCVLGSDIVMANNASLAGHVHIDDHAILGGFAMVHQFCKIGAYAFLQFAAGVNRDVPPFVVASGIPAKPAGLNTEGLRRHGFDAERVGALKRAYKLLYRSGLRLEQAREQIAALSMECPDVARFSHFLESNPAASSADMTLRIAIVAGELSGDQLGGALAASLGRQAGGRLELTGVAGPSMRAAGSGRSPIAASSR